MSYEKKIVFPRDNSLKMIDQFNHMPFFSLVKADCYMCVCMCVCLSNYSHVIALAIDKRGILSLQSDYIGIE